MEPEDLITYGKYRVTLTDPNTAGYSYDLMFRLHRNDNAMWFTGIGRTNGEYFLDWEDIASCVELARAEALYRLDTALESFKAAAAKLGEAWGNDAALDGFEMEGTYSSELPHFDKLIRLISEMEITADDYPINA